MSRSKGKTEKDPTLVPLVHSQIKSKSQVFKFQVKICKSYLQGPNQVLGEDQPQVICDLSPFLNEEQVQSQGLTSPKLGPKFCDL